MTWALASLRRRQPRLDITVRVADRETVAADVARGRLDAGLVDGLAAPSDPLPVPAPLAATGVGEDRIAVALPADHPLSGRVGVGLTDLADARWIEAPGVAPPLADVRRAAGTDGFRAAFRYEGTDTATLIHLAGAGHGLTLLSAALLSAAAIASRATSGPVAAGPIASPRLVHRVELLHGTLAPDSPAAALAALLT